MFTKIKNKFGFILSYNTTQYYSGLYVIINDNPMSQFCLQEEERHFHIRIRRETLKNDGQILYGTKIKDYKGRYKINKFKNEI